MGDQLFERPVILRRRQVRIIRARTAPRTTAADRMPRPPRDIASPCTGATRAAGSSGNKLTSHGFGRSPFPAVGLWTGWDRVARAALPLLGAVLLSLVENLVPGLGVALAVVKAAGVQVSVWREFGAVALGVGS